jgi:hypothetical protein
MSSFGSLRGATLWVLVFLQKSKTGSQSHSANILYRSLRLYYAVLHPHRLGAAKSCTSMCIISSQLHIIAMCLLWLFVGQTHASTAVRTVSSAHHHFGVLANILIGHGCPAACQAASFLDHAQTLAGRLIKNIYSARGPRTNGTITRPSVHFSTTRNPLSQ